ncbi:uncharacterized protein BX664DRAFT_321116 [Halteromyces radiatus]|uniref:uncharacterized protein n=1 Tax=Halteromyces radiatus TaxID=101107 RepID=UPI00221FFC30|nr:uncharacterized protein BX664DRAFT_321116 [Halteromyces radiatus]KAI8099377.1 hypothetical protein BX664DRAFT_321116 [Halteromyces radiatus]
MTSEEENIAIQTLLEEGNKAYASKDYETSTTKFGEACQRLDVLHGELDPRNGDAYFLYGRALLDYAIQQNAVLGQSAQATAEEVETQQLEAKVSSENSNPRFQIDEKPTFVSDAGNVEDNDDSEEEEENNENQEDDFETAWDVLDVARVIFEKGEDDESKLKLADVLLSLGDVSLETEKFNDALPDFKKAIDIKQSLLQPDDRQLAEAHYKYSLALELSSDSQGLALDELQKTKTVLKNRIETLEKGDIKDDNKGKSKYTPSEAEQKEITEIQDLISDLDEKVVELSNRQESEREAEKLLKSLLGGMANETSTTSVNSSAPVHDLTTLVKRKVKEIVDSNSDNPSDSKKPKSE